MLAPPNDVVLRWHVSHAAVVTMWFDGLPVAVCPLWQLAQPDVIPVWSMRPPSAERSVEYLSRDEVARLLAAVDADRWDVLAVSGRLAVYTGLLVCEVYGLRWRSGDFDRNITPQKCLDNITRYSRPGSIVVLHDSLKAEQNLRFALPALLDFYSAKGWKFECLGYGV